LLAKDPKRKARRILCLLLKKVFRDFRSFKLPGISGFVERELIFSSHTPRRFCLTIIPIFYGRSNKLLPQHKCWGLLRVDPGRRFFTPLSKAWLGAAEWVNEKCE
jgi:hypothetical protein